MDILLHPSYFPSIASFVAIAKANQITLEICDNYQKQTYRNRASIYGANGRLSLTTPVIYSQNNRQLYKDIKISAATNWQDLHWKSIQTAYSSSPFFEFYEDDLKPLFTTSFESLLEFNMKCLEVICECLQWPFNFSFTEVYEKSPNHIKDYRFLIEHRKEQQESFDSYVQVFNDKHGFISNLSILDLICNEGPSALLYLESQNLQG